MLKNLKLVALAGAACFPIALAMAPIGVSGQPEHERHGEHDEHGEHEEHEHAEHEHGEDSLHDHMEGIEHELKFLLKNAGDIATQQEAMLEHVDLLQRHVLEAKLLVPELIEEEMSGAEQTEAKADYRRRMAEVLAGTAEVEIAVLEGDGEAVTDLIRNSLLEMRNDGHDLYQEEDDD